MEASQATRPAISKPLRVSDSDARNAVYALAVFYRNHGSSSLDAVCNSLVRRQLDCAKTGKAELEHLSGAAREKILPLGQDASRSDRAFVSGIHFLGIGAGIFAGGIVAAAAGGGWPLSGPMVAAGLVLIALGAAALRSSKKSLRSISERIEREIDVGRLSAN